MERDFMGLNSKEEAIEADGPQDLNNRQSGKNINPPGPAQLTIFYKGMVNVYEDMSPEKAQAIMLLAGNGAKAQAHAPTPRTPAVDVAHVGQPMNTTVSSPMTVGPLARDGTKVMSSLRHVMQSDVPQMREASLARFLEKRRERVMASAPYNSKPGSSSATSKDVHKK